MMAGVVALVVSTLVLGAVVAAALHLGDIARLLRRAHDRLRPPPPVPTGPSIEEIARSLRRLRGDVLAPRPGTTMARRRGTALAYDDLLVLAARALDVPDTLSGVPPEAPGHRAARLRLEQALRRAGLVLD
jgi:hypothetical protein